MVATERHLTHENVGSLCLGGSATYGSLTDPFKLAFNPRSLKAILQENLKEGEDNADPMAFLPLPLSTFTCLPALNSPSTTYGVWFSLTSFADNPLFVCCFCLSSEGLAAQSSFSLLIFLLSIENFSRENVTFKCSHRRKAVHATAAIPGGASLFGCLSPDE